MQFKLLIIKFKQNLKFNSSKTNLMIFITYSWSSVRISSLKYYLVDYILKLLIFNNYLI